VQEIRSFLNAFLRCEDFFSNHFAVKTKAQGREAPLPLRAAHAHFAMHAMPATCAAVANVRENLELGGFSFENTRR
jgi:hypothetical protein